MKGVPPEIDALMWRLAEEGGPVAHEEFEHRHTRYAPELSRRVRMVAELRAAGKTVAHRPIFTPRPKQVATTPRWAVGMAMGLAVLAVGAMAYVAASGEPRPKAPAIPGPVPFVSTSKPGDDTPSKIVPAPNLPKVVQKEPEQPEKKAKYLESRNVQIMETGLTRAIALVAAGGGLKATIAPGFRDQTVSLDYRDLNTLDILNTMGERYGFTVMDEGQGEILVVPARDGSESTRRIGG